MGRGIAHRWLIYRCATSSTEAASLASRAADCFHIRGGCRWAPAVETSSASSVGRRASSVERRAARSVLGRSSTRTRFLHPFIFLEPRSSYAANFPNPFSSCKLCKPDGLVRHAPLREVAVCARLMPIPRAAAAAATTAAAAAARRVGAERLRVEGARVVFRRAEVRC